MKGEKGYATMPNLSAVADKKLAIMRERSRPNQRIRVVLWVENANMLF